jgi:hypothetical protein
VNTRLRTETGFTIIEVMVAIILLLVGVLGSVKLVDQAQQGTTATRAREGGTNIARQLIDNARNMPYNSLVGTVDGSDVPTGLLTPAYKALPGLADSVPSSSSYQLVRRGITYTIDATACIIDDPKDGSRIDDSLAGLCDGSLQPPKPATPATDNNPDDFRRVQIQIWWDLRGVTHNCVRHIACLTQTGLIPNPQLGPRITNVVGNPAIADSQGTTSVDFTVTTTPADSLNWAVDDGHSSGQGSTGNGGTTWTYTWQLGATDCQTGLVDGAYTFSLQAIRAALPGNLFAQQYTVNRCLPRAPTGVAGGRDTRIGPGGGASANGIEDLQWAANPERDIVGYRVYQVVGTPDTSIGIPDGTTTGDDRLVGTFTNGTTGNTYPGCGPLVDGTSNLFCFDPQPPAAGASDPSYYVVAMDRPLTGAGNSTSGVDCAAYLASTNGALPNGTNFTLAIDKSSGDPATYDRYGCPSAILKPPDIGEGASRPTFGGNPSVGTQPTSDSQLIQWNLSGIGGGTGAIRFFRIYLDGTDYTNRIARTSSGTDTSFVDQNAGNYSSGTHHYYVTAVDQAFQESDPQPAAGATFTVP